MPSSEEANNDGTAGPQVSAGEFGSAADSVGSGIESGFQDVYRPIYGGLRDTFNGIKAGVGFTEKKAEEAPSQVEFAADNVESGIESLAKSLAE